MVSSIELKYSNEIRTEKTLHAAKRQRLWRGTQSHRRPHGQEIRACRRRCIDGFGLQPAQALKCHLTESQRGRVLAEQVNKDFLLGRLIQKSREIKRIICIILYFHDIFAFGTYLPQTENYLRACARYEVKKIAQCASQCKCMGENGAIIFISSSSIFSNYPFKFGCLRLRNNHCGNIPKILNKIHLHLKFPRLWSSGQSHSRLLALSALQLN